MTSDGCASFTTCLRTDLAAAVLLDTLAIVTTRLRLPH